MQIERYFLPGGSVSFWHTPFAPVLYDYPTLANYYIDFTAKTHYAGPFDENGVPLLDYRGRIGRQYNPCATAQYALGWYQRWRSGEIAARERFLAMADWLRDSMHVDAAACGWWYYDFDLDAYNVRTPWVSGLAQAQAVTTLLRAESMTNDASYGRAARYGCAGLLRPVEQGGVLRVENGYAYLEEIVATRRTAILDGMIFAVFGLYDYCFCVDEPHAKKTLVACVDTLERILPLYDLGYWSRADLYQDNPPMVASRFYHGLHIAQLTVLAEVTGRLAFRSWAERWENYARKPSNVARAVINKMWFKLRHY